MPSADYVSRIDCSHLETTFMCEHHGISTDKPRVVSLQGMQRRDVMRALLGGGVMVSLGGAAGCESAAELFAPSDADLVPLAAQAWAETKSQTPISKDARANQRLQAVGAKISQV